MYRLMIENESTVKARENTKNMQTKNMIELSTPLHTEDDEVATFVPIKNISITPCIYSGIVNAEIIDKTTKRTRDQLSRLTEMQRQLIIKTFARMNNSPMKAGLKIFVKLFSENPQYKQIWPQFRAIPDSSLTNADQLRKHATVYMCALKKINNSILDENELALQMSLIAMAHIKWNVHRSHIMNMLHPVLDTVKEYNDGEMDASTEAAWTTFYDIIANVIEIFRDKQLE